MHLNIIFLNVINITLELWGFFFMITCAGIIYSNKRENRAKSGMLAVLFTVDAFMLLSDAVGNLFTGNMSAHADFLVRFCFSMHFALIALLPFCAMLYFSTLLVGLQNYTRAVMFSSAVLSGVMISMIIRNIFDSSLFYFNSLNYYFRAAEYTNFAILGALQMTLLATMLLVVIFGRYSPDAMFYLPLLILPMAANAFQLLHYGLNLNNISITVCLMIVFVGYQGRINHEFYEKKSDLAQKDAELALTRVQVSISQMQPHFLFNTLGSIEQLCKTQPGFAAEATHHFSQYLRNNINALSRSSMILFNEELLHIRNYIWLEAMRFGDDLSFVEEIEFSDFLIPSLSIQPLVENCIKLGMRLTEGQLEVKLKVKEEEGDIIIVLSDNSGGFDTNNPPPNEERALLGLTEIQERIHLMLNGDVIFEGQVDGGSRMTMRFPKEAASVQEKAV